MIDLALIPKLQALWVEADAAFRADDAYLLDMCDGIVDVMMRRERARLRAEARRGDVGGTA
jgi:hypothetical protein